MKKHLLTALAVFTVAGFSAQAQTILSEDFENGKTSSDYDQVASGEGWTVVNGYKGDERKYNWFNYFSLPGENNQSTITGNNCAACDGSIFGYGEGVGPREELLITPELDLNGDYQLQFSWKVSPMNSDDKSRYDLQVRVVTDGDLNNAETIFSIQNEKMLRESGVAVFPITDWSIYTSKVDLSDFKGEKVKLAFVFKMYNEIGNIVYLDDISVSKFVAPTGPQASINLERYDFGDLYVGQKRYSDLFTLTNVGKDGLKVTSVDYPQGVTGTLDPSKVDLERYRGVNFQLAYEASLTSAAKGDVVIHTNGGDITIPVSANKQIVPDGYYLESFEGYFPPAGWTNNGWSATQYALEGDQTAVGYGDFGVSTLTSPRLDLTDGGNVTFTFFNQFDAEEIDSPYYDITLEVSTDGGNTWTQKWSSANAPLNTIQTATVKLGYGDDNSYIRWKYPAVESDDEGAYEHSTFYLDGVLLPNVYGADGVPMTAKLVSPKNGEEDVYPRDIKLEWQPAQFAKGYKLYLGTSSAANEQIDGKDLGDVLTYVVPSCDYETDYTWKIVAYNDKGDGKASTGHFTTQKDASVLSYPYEENFLGENIPTGWNTVPSGGAYARGWSKNELKPYVNDGKEYGVVMSTWLETGESNSIVSPEFQLLEDKPMTISFIWGDEHPASLKIDPSGAVKKNNVEPNNGHSASYFDIYVDGEWVPLTYISENYPDDQDDYKYWINEKVDLTPYIGKRVMFRWRHAAFSGRDNGAGLTHVILEENESQKGAFNLSEWKAGKVNYEKAVDSGEIFTIINNGTAEMTVKGVEFNTPNFSTSLKAGDKVAVDGVLPFSVRFNALTTGKQNDADVEDEMTVEFESGYTMTLPLSGTALPEGTYYYAFEPNDLELAWDEDMTMIDADNRPGYDIGSWWVYYSMGGQKGAFSAENDSMEHGMYGMMAPVSGNWALVGASPEDTAPDNWIISKKMKATSTSKFDFYARNWESLESVLPDAKHHVTVYVSTGDNKKTTDFTDVVMRDTEMPFLERKNWNHYEVDLKDYAGKEIYVALRHSATAATNLAFFDDFRFSNFDLDESGIGEIGSVDADADVEVYNLGGVRVAAGKGVDTLNGLGKGLYIVKVTTAEGTRAYRVMK